MIPRHQLPVATPISRAALVRAAHSTLAGHTAHREAAVTHLAKALAAKQVALTDSGTSALVIALRLAVGKGGTVAYPGYGCVDLAAAALYADVRVRLYDLEPSTLGPDLESLEATLVRGASAVVVAHLYGFPVAMDEVITLSARHGAIVIEDAAQAAGGTLGERPLGSIGELAVLSFGRGKGTGGGSGGAIVANHTRWAECVAATAGAAAHSARGFRDLAAATAQALVGRPAIYGLPLAIPGLRLGEMVYRPAHEPRTISCAAAAILRDALDRPPTELEARRANAARLDAVAASGQHVRPVSPVAGARPGYLRYPVVDRAGRRPDRRLGVMRGYPFALHEQQQLRPVLRAGEPPTPGSVELRASLFTLPTHGMVAERDHQAMAAWLGSTRGSA